MTCLRLPSCQGAEPLFQPYCVGCTNPCCSSFTGPPPQCLQGGRPMPIPSPGTRQAEHQVRVSKPLINVEELDTSTTGLQTPHRTAGPKKSVPLAPGSWFLASATIGSVHVPDLRPNPHLEGSRTNCFCFSQHTKLLSSFVASTAHFS